MGELSQAYSIFINDDEKLSKTLIGGLFTFFSFLLIPVFFVQGYYVQILKETEDPETNMFPEWQNWADLFENGAIAFFVSVLVMLPAYMLIYWPQLTGNSNMALVGIGYILLLGISYFFPIIYALLFRDGFSSLFNVSRIWAIGSSKAYFLTALSIMAVGLFIGAVAIAIILGTLGFALLVMPFVFVGVQMIFMYAYGSVITSVDPQNPHKSVSDSLNTEPSTNESIDTSKLE